MCQGSTLRNRTTTVEDAKVDTLSNDSTEVGYILTRKVVSHHNRPNDAWVIHDGHVYDITLFLETHPGGAEVLEPHLGNDVTSIMTGEQAPHAHSAFAFKLLHRYLIGTITDADPGSVALDGNVDATSGQLLVRWDRPILHQVGMLGDKYHRWIHSFPTTDHTVKMFTNDTIEKLTKCPWYVPLVVWIPVVLAEVAHYVILMGGMNKVNAMTFITSFMCGVLFWLLFEYSLHRWVFHLRTTGYWSNIFHFLVHGHHHITPMDFDRLVFPPIPALLIAWPFWLGSPLVLGVSVGYPWLFGFVAGYLIYDMTHFWIHHAVPRNVYLKGQKRRHVHHHYFQPSVNFGISNPLFDYVFRTFKEPV